jgi:acyl carrier protein
LEFAGLVFDLEVCFDIVIDLDKMKSDMTVAQLIELIEYHRKNRNHVEV